MGSVNEPPSNQHTGPNNANAQPDTKPASVEEGKAVPEYLPGFVDVAAYISLDQDGGLYHRFRSLSARNILCMQAEIASVADGLEWLDKEDSERLHDSKNPDLDDIGKCARDWDSFAEVSLRRDGNEKDRMSLTIKLRTLLRDYYQAVILDRQIANIAGPPETYLKTYKKFVAAKSHPVGRGINMPGIDLEHTMPSDYVLTYTQSDSDRLSSLIQNFITKRMPFLQAQRKVPESWNDFNFYSDTMLERVVAWLSIMIAAALLICSIVALNFAPGKNTRLGILAAFTVTFATILGILTNAKRTEVFGATAAFVAVLVVYVSGNLGD